MTELSPAAQAVRQNIDEIMKALQPYSRCGYSSTDSLSITIETNQAGLEAAVSQLAAAVLRAAADQVVPANGSRKNNEIRAEILAIADELETK
jgi:hypothetical protein